MVNNTSKLFTMAIVIMHWYNERTVTILCDKCNNELGNTDIWAKLPTELLGVNFNITRSVPSKPCNWLANWITFENLTA